MQPFQPHDTMPMDPLAPTQQDLSILGIAPANNQYSITGSETPVLEPFRLSQMMSQMCDELMRRMDEIDDRIASIKAQVLETSSYAEAVKGCLNLDQFFPPISPVLQPPPQQPQMWLYRIELIGITEKFCTDRPFPAFQVRVVDASTGFPCLHAADAQVHLSLYDGYNRPLPPTIATLKAKISSLSQGVAHVSGLCFSEVSSKHGDVFYLEAGLRGSEPLSSQTEPARSPGIAIMTYRVWGDQKTYVGLNGSSPICKLPLIGRKYSQKLCEEGYTTVSSLAGLLNQPKLKHTVWSRIRQPKGPLTEDRFSDLVVTALTITNGSLDVTQSFATSPLPPAVGSKRSHNMLNVDSSLPGHVTGLSFHDDVSPSSSTTQTPNPSYFATPDDRQTRSLDSKPANGAALSVLSFAAGTGGKHDEPETAPLPLHTAIAKGNLQGVRAAIKQVLLTNPEKFNEGNTQEFTPLMLACALGQVDIVLELCGVEHVQIDWPRLNGWTALHIAVLTKQAGCVQALLSKGSSPALEPASLWTPQMIAVLLAHTHWDGTRTQSNRGPLSNSNCSWDQVLDAFMCKGSPSSAVDVNELLRSIEQAASTSPQHPPTLMHYAAFVGNTELAQALVTAGVCSNEARYKGYLPQHVAAALGYAEVLQVLINHFPALLDATTNDGHTALSLSAISHDATDCVDVLHAAGASNTASKLPAAVAAIICGNIGALLILANGHPYRLQHHIAKSTLSTADVANAVGASHIASLCRALAKHATD